MKYTSVIELVSLAALNKRYLGGISIKRKVFYSFAIIGVLFLAQSSVSGFSMFNLSDNYVVSAEQGAIKELSLYISELQVQEEKFVKEWASGVEVISNPLVPILSFNSTSESISDTYLTLENRTLGLYDIADTELIHLSNATTIIEDIKVLREDYLSFIYENIFTIPSLRITSNIQFVAKDTQKKGNALSTEVATWLFDRNSSSLTTLNTRLAAIVGTPLQINTAINPLLTIDANLHAEKVLIREAVSTFTININTHFNRIVEVASLNSSLDDLTTDQLAKVSRGVVALNGNVTSLNREVEVLISDGQIDLFNLKNGLGQVSIDVTALNDKLEELTLWATQGQAIINDNFRTVVWTQAVVLIITLVLSWIFLIVIASLINKDVINPIQVITQWSDYIASGDLSRTRKPDDRKDEVGIMQNNFRKMNSSLRAIIGDVKGTAVLISDTAEDLAANTEEMNATAEEVAAIAQSMATGSTQQAEIITSIVEEIQEANMIVENVITQITKNLSIVKDLSEQTNVLALNTAIEAANAGEYGRGFTVIADNIRKMSDQSARTAKIITRDSKDILRQLQLSFGSMTDKIENVAAVSEETAASAQEVSASAEELTATMQDIAAKSQILNDQSKNSIEMVKTFNLGDNVIFDD